MDKKVVILIAIFVLGAAYALGALSQDFYYWQFGLIFTLIQVVGGFLLLTTGEFEEKFFYFALIQILAGFEIMFILQIVIIGPSIWDMGMREITKDGIIFLPAINATIALVLIIVNFIDNLLKHKKIATN